MAARGNEALPTKIIIN